MSQVDENTDITKTVLVAKDRRRFGRFPPQFEMVHLRTKAGHQIAAQVENVSLGGIGLQLESNEGIQTSDEVDIIYLYAALPAIVRYVESREDGKTCAGVEWANPPSDANRSLQPGKELGA